jgi:hypothetical protein
MTIILDANRGSGFSGLYSACQPKASPFQGFSLRMQLGSKRSSLVEIEHGSRHNGRCGIMPSDFNLSSYHVFVVPYFRTQYENP